jgi:hypothetical protein
MTYGGKGREPGRRVHRVGAEQRKVELAGEGLEQGDAVVELVVAQCRGVVADVVHDRRHGVHMAVADWGDPGEVVGQRRPLDRVARVDHQGAVTAALGTHGLHERGHLGQTDVVRGGVGVLKVLEVVPV